MSFFFLPDKTQYSFPLLSPSQVIESIHDLNMLVDLPGLEEKDFKQPTVSKWKRSYDISKKTFHLPQCSLVSYTWNQHLKNKQGLETQYNIMC